MNFPFNTVFDRGNRKLPITAFLFLLLMVWVLGGCGEAPSEQREDRRSPVVPPGQVTLTWDAPTHNADGSKLQDLAGYRIFIQDETFPSQRSVLIGNVTRYTVTGLKPGHQYRFRVAAYDRMGNTSEWSQAMVANISFPSKINLVYAPHRATPTPAGWVEYDGAPYDPVRGFGWLTDLRKQGRDRGVKAKIELADTTVSNAQELGRPELANWQGRHQENHPLVFRLDLPNGWYKVKCSSVDPGTQLPLVNQRSFKCRAHDVVVAGPNYGAPLAVKGEVLVEGSGVVEVTEGHLRLVIGDPAYAGWTWEHPGPWYAGWPRWIGFEQSYATGWWQKISRIADPGFHMLRLNALEVELVDPPATRGRRIFRDLFQRDDHPLINQGLSQNRHWETVKMDPAWSDILVSDIVHTSLRTVSTPNGVGGIGLLHKSVSPEEGMVRYATRVSLFTGEGSQIHSGLHEAGLLLLVDSPEASDFSSTFVGVGFEGSSEMPQGKFIYRMGDGRKGYRTNLEVPDAQLPFAVREGEYEIVALHDVKTNAIVQVRVNGVDLIDRIPESDRTQRISQGSFGLRSVMDRKGTEVELKQFYWSFEVDALD